MIKVVLFILCAEVWGSIGHVFFKKSVASQGRPSFESRSAYLSFLKSLLENRFVWLGFSFLTIRTVIWLMALAQTNLSTAFPIDSMQYIMVLIAARLFLGEKLDRNKIIGTLLAVAGIILVSAGKI